MIICTRPDPPDDHLQITGPSERSFVRGRLLRMFICNRPVRGAHQGDRGDRTEGGEEGGGKRGEEGGEGKLVQAGRADIEGSIRGPRGP